MSCPFHPGYAILGYTLWNRSDAMKPRIKQLLNFLFIFGILAIVLIVGLSGNEFSDAWNALISLSPQWVILCLICWAVYMLLDALCASYFLKKHGHPIPYGYSLLVALVGMYYCNITPGASGGQPMQIYYLKKQGVPVGIGSSCMTIKFFCYQFILMVIGTVFWLFYPDFVARQVGSHMWILIVGYICNLGSITLVMAMALCKPAVRFVIRWCIRIGARLHICKDPEASARKWEETLITFNDSVKMATRRPKELLVQMAIAGVQILSLMLVVVCLYHAFGPSGHTLGQLITLGLMLYISAAYTPLPGASGAQEGVFALYFHSIFPEAKLLVALLVWRFFTYYISLIVGGVLSLQIGRIASKMPENTKNM